MVDQARVAHRGNQRGTFGALQCFLNHIDLGTIYCRHHFLDIYGWLVTIHAHSSLESGRACTYAQYAIWSTEYGIWNMEFGIQYGKWDVECGTWNIQYGARRKACGVCSMENGVRIKEYGLWSMEE